MEALGSHDRYERGVCTKKKKGISIVEGKERRGTQVHQQTIEERVYQILKIASNGTSILCRKEGWEEVDGTEL